MLCSRRSRSSSSSARPRWLWPAWWSTSASSSVEDAGNLDSSSLPSRRAMASSGPCKRPLGRRLSPRRRQRGLSSFYCSSSVAAQDEIARWPRESEHSNGSSSGSALMLLGSVVAASCSGVAATQSTSSATGCPWRGGGGGKSLKKASHTSLSGDSWERWICGWDYIAKENIEHQVSIRELSALGRR